MECPFDAVTSSVLKLQIAQRAVNSLVQELIERASSDPFNASSQPDVRLRLSERRTEVDDAMDELRRLGPDGRDASRARFELGLVLNQRVERLDQTRPLFTRPLTRVL